MKENTHTELTPYGTFLINTSDVRGQSVVFSNYYMFYKPVYLDVQLYIRVSQGFWRTREYWQNIEGNKGTLANFWEQGNKIRKITVRKHSENVWEHRAILEGNMGTRTPPPPWETLIYRTPPIFRLRDREPSPRGFLSVFFSFVAHI